MADYSGAKGITSGAANANYLTAPAVLLQRDLYHTLIDRYNDEDFLEILTDSASNKLFSPPKEMAKVPIYYSFFNEPLYSLLTLTASQTVTTGSAASTTITGMTTAQTSILVVGNLICAPGGVVWRVRSITDGSSITIDTVSGAAPSTTLVNTAVCSVFSNAQQEQATGATPQKWDVDSVYNYIQLFNNATSVTDIESMTMIEVNVDGKPYLLNYELVQLLRAHRGHISLAMLLGQISGSTLTFTNNVPASTIAQTTRGLDQYITAQGGNVQNLAVSNTVALSDIRALNSTMTTARCPQNYFAIGAQDVISQYSDFMKNLPSSSASQPAGGGINSGRIMINGKDLDLEVEKFNYGGRTFNFKAINAFSNNQVINFDDGSGNKMSPATSLYLLPTDMTATYGEGRVPYFRYRYMNPPAGIMGASANRSVNGPTVETITGFLAPIATSRTREMVVEYSTNMGFELFNSNKFTRLNSIAS